MSQEEIYERLARAEAKLDEHSKILEKQVQKNELQVEMNTLLKLQIESNKEQNKQMEKFAETMNKVDENLTRLNTSQEQLNSNQQQLGTRVSDIENTLQENRTNANKWIKHIAWTAIPVVIAAYIIYKFNIG